MKIFDDYKIIIFDLDDTLYSEFDYLKFAYANIAKSVCLKEKNKFLSEDIVFKFLLNEYLNDGRKELFQKLSSRFELVNYNLNNFLNDLRTVKIKKNTIKLFPEISKLLEKLTQKNKKIYILTNGCPLQQLNKFNSIEFPFKESINIILASQNKRLYEKPNPYYIFKVMKNNKVEKSDIIFIGDSTIDKQTANTAGIRFLNIKDYMETSLLSEV